MSRGIRFGNLYTTTQLIERIYFALGSFYTLKHEMIKIIIRLLLIDLMFIFSAVITSYDDGSQPADTLLCLP